jgi:hypothetical protein
MSRNKFYIPESEYSRNYTDKRDKLPLPNNMNEIEEEEND